MLFYILWLNFVIIFCPEETHRLIRYWSLTIVCHVVLFYLLFPSIKYYRQLKITVIDHIFHFDASKLTEQNFISFFQTHRSLPITIHTDVTYWYYSFSTHRVSHLRHTVCSSTEQNIHVHSIFRLELNVYIYIL